MQTNEFIKYILFLLFILVVFYIFYIKDKTNYLLNAPTFQATNTNKAIVTVLCTFVPPSQLGLLMSKNPVIFLYVKLFSFDITNMGNNNLE